MTILTFEAAARNRNVLQISEDSLDVHIPSYPPTPRSLLSASQESVRSHLQCEELNTAVEYLHRDHELLLAAENGNEKLIEFLLRKGTEKQQTDHLGRNALHLAVCTDSYRAIRLLLEAGVACNVKDNVGMTPLSLCLMRRPSLRVANLLFQFGAAILPRTSPMDTGLFIQFVMMSSPTPEEAKILHLLVEKGAVVNDPDAPGGRQALHFAAMSNNCDLIRILINLGADLFMLNHRGETPSEVAATFRCKKAHNLLESLK